MSNARLSVDVRRLEPVDTSEFSAMRLESLCLHPSAYSMDEALWRAAPKAQVESMLMGPAETNGIVVGAFSQHLVGFVGLKVSQRGKARHLATMWGLFVKPAFRGQGVGDALMTELLAQAKQIAAVEQVRVMVPADSKHAIALFERSGYSTYGCELRGRKTEAGYHDLNYMQLFL